MLRLNSTINLFRIRSNSCRPLKSNSQPSPLEAMILSPSKTDIAMPLSLSWGLRGGHIKTNSIINQDANNSTIKRNGGERFSWRILLQFPHNNLLFLSFFGCAVAWHFQIELVYDTTKHKYSCCVHLVVSPENGYGKCRSNCSGVDSPSGFGSAFDATTLTALSISLWLNEVAPIISMSNGI